MRWIGEILFGRFEEREEDWDGVEKVSRDCSEGGEICCLGVGVIWGFGWEWFILS